MSKARVIAFYLPQFHPIPENDQWWGKGFTEWTSVGKAKPLFKGHYQPKVPADLGYYDLRSPWVREEQAELAREAGVEGFAYWHYWFGGGKTILQRPFLDMMASKSPDFPFCLAWGNHSWSNKTWKTGMSKKAANTMIAEQTYPGVEDFTAHFNYVLPAFKDERYIKVDGKPLFIIFDSSFKELPLFIETWQKLAKQNGLKGIYFVGYAYNAGYNKVNNPKEKRPYLALDEAGARYKYALAKGLDGVNSIGMARAEYIVAGKYKQLFKKVLEKFTSIKPLNIFDQKKINEHIFVPEDKWENVYPTIMPNWDRSPRAGRNAIIYVNSTPEVFKQHILDAVELVKDKAPEHRILFLKSWNEWGEGNYVEPDLRYGKGYIKALAEVLKD